MLPRVRRLQLRTSDPFPELAPTARWRFPPFPARPSPEDSRVPEYKNREPQAPWFRGRQEIASLAERAVTQGQQQPSRKPDPAGQKDPPGKPLWCRCGLADGNGRPPERSSRARSPKTVECSNQSPD